jgi:hypothetical protein
LQNKQIKELIGFGEQRKAHATLHVSLCISIFYLLTSHHREFVKYKVAACKRPAKKPINTFLALIIFNGTAVWGGQKCPPWQ